MPSSLNSLDCCFNQLTSLPVLPNSIVGLNCELNSLANLPVLPSSLRVLYCDLNQLTSLPVLPTGLSNLNCSANQLTSLPSLPNSSLNELQCYNNNISCFPLFPSSLNNSSYFNISNNPFTCLPNYVPAMNAATLAYPLCILGDTINNHNGCNGSSGILGYSIEDINGDCIYNTGDSSLINIHEKLYDSGSNLISQTFSAMNGVYDFPEPVGTYTVNIDTAGVPYAVQCVHPGLDSVCTLTTAIPLITNVNFPVTCKPGFDVGVQSVVEEGMVFPNMQHTLKFVAGDISNWYQSFLGKRTSNLSA